MDKYIKFMFAVLLTVACFVSVLGIVLYFLDISGLI